MNGDEEEIEIGTDNVGETRSKFIPSILMLFSFIPMIFMVRFTSAFMEEHLPDANVTSFYGGFYIFWIFVFFLTFLVVMITQASRMITARRFRLGLGDE